MCKYHFEIKKKKQPPPKKRGSYIIINSTTLSENDMNDVTLLNLSSHGFGKIDLSFESTIF